MGLWLLALITAFWTCFLFGSWQGTLRGATDNEQLAAEPPSVRALTWGRPGQAHRGRQKAFSHLVSVLPYTHTHTCTCTHVCAHIHTRTCTCLHTHVHAYINTRAHTYIRIHMHTYMHTRVHTHVHTHTHRATTMATGFPSLCLHSSSDRDLITSQIVC